MHIWVVTFVLAFIVLFKGRKVLYRTSEFFHGVFRALEYLEEPIQCISSS